MSNLLNEASAIITAFSPGVIGVFGAKVELIPSTARKSGWIWVYYCTIPGPIFFTQAVIMKLNILKGAAGVETLEICHLPQACNSQVSPEGPYWQGQGFPWEFAAGIRLAVEVAGDANMTGFPATHLIQVRLIEKPK